MTNSVGQKLPNPWGLYDMHMGMLPNGASTGMRHIPLGLPLDPQGPVRGGGVDWSRGCAEGPL